MVSSCTLRSTEIGPIRVPGVSEGLLFGRLLMMQSYLFVVIAWPKGASRAVRQRTLEDLGCLRPHLPEWRALKDLRATREWVQIDAPCMDVREWFHARALHEARNA